MVVWPAAGGGRWVEVVPERLPRWVAGFAERHHLETVSVTDAGLHVTTADGIEATFQLPCGWPGQPAAHLEALVTAATTPRRFGLLLARQSSVAAGIVEGAALVATTVRSRYVQGRTAAGGSSQQRYARRRGNQARSAARVGVDATANLLLPAAHSLHALITGGDRRAVETVLADPRLRPLGTLVVARFLRTAEPRRHALEAAVPAARAVRIRLVDPKPDGHPDPEAGEPGRFGG